MTHLEKVPSTGDHFEWGGYLFEVVDMDEHRVDKILVTPLKKRKEKARTEKPDLINRFAKPRNTGRD